MHYFSRRATSNICRRAPKKVVDATDWKKLLVDIVTFNYYLISVLGKFAFMQVY